MTRAVAVLAALASPWLLSAQQDRATITGSVTDPSGAAVSGVRVELMNAKTEASYLSTTNGLGRYAIPNLPVGVYNLRFEAHNFKSVAYESVALDVAQVLRIDVRLEVGMVSESLKVQPEAGLLQQDSPEVGTVLEAGPLAGLPLGFSGGRYAEDFAYKLTPGVGGNNWESRINGSAAFSKAVVLDGADGTIYIGGQFGESTPSLEAFEEVKIQTSGMSAEYGRTGGGVFNFVMKSGTNQVHGSAIGLIHNEWMDANSFVSNFYGRPRQRDRRQDWGGSLGGPVWLPRLYNGKSKTFFYSAYERYKESYSGAGSPTVTVPLDEFWDGDLSRLLASGTRGVIYDPGTTRIEGGRALRDPFAGNRIPRNRITGPSQKLGEIFRRHYSPTVQESDGRTALLNNSFFPVSNQAGFTQNQFSLKADHSLSVRHKLIGSFVYVDRPRMLLDQGGVWDFAAEAGGPLSRARLQWVRTWYGRAGYDWTLTPSLLNHLQLGFNRQRNPSLSAHLGENGVAALGLAGLSKSYNFPEIRFGDGNYPVNYPALGYQTNDFGAGQNFQIIDTVSWIRGRHSMRMGFDWRRSYLRWRSDDGPAQINFGPEQTGLQGFGQTGNGFASMLLGMVAGASVPVPTPTGSRFLNLALFVQDDLRLTNRLTLNFGLRWDYQPLPVEDYNRLSNWSTSLMDPLWRLPGALEFASPERRQFAGNAYRDFSPRLGFAYQVTSKMVIRGSYGIFYLGRNANGWSGVPWGQTAGFGQENRINAAVSYEAAWNWSQPYPGVVRSLPRNTSLASGSPGVWGIVSYDPNAGKNGYTQQWNLNLQRELPHQMVIDVGYLGSKGTGIQANELRRLNQLDPMYLALGDDLGAGVTRASEIPASVAAAGGRYPFGEAGTWVPAYQTLLPYPHMMAWNEIKSAFSPLGFHTYHSLQAQWNKRFAAGLNFLSNYTFAKAIDNVRSAFGDTWGANGGRPLNYYNQSLDKSVSDADRTHTVKAAARYELPLGRGRIRGGWVVQHIGNYSSGWPLGIGGSWTPNSNFATNSGYARNPDGRPLRSPWNASNIDMSRISQASTAHRYIDSTLFVDPAALGRYQRGNTSYRLSGLRSPWQLSDDFSLQKSFQAAESVRVQLRVELLNAFNRTLWGNIESNAASPLFGQVTGASDWYAPRKIHLGIRADW